MVSNHITISFIQLFDFKLRNEMSAFRACDTDTWTADFESTNLFSKIKGLVAETRVFASTHNIEFGRVSAN